MSSIPFATRPIVEAIKLLYGMGKDINKCIDDLIGSMKDSENSTISRTGKILEGAKYGFGIGYVTSVAIIALGQMILGNPLSAAATVGSATVLSNPIAMTCAAVGAVYYGWSALSDAERNAIVKRLCEGLEVGAELIKSIVAFVIAKAKELFSAENLREFKKFIREAASSFGKTLGDITGSIKDRAADAYRYISARLRRKRRAAPA